VLTRGPNCAYGLPLMISTLECYFNLNEHLRTCDRGIVVSYECKLNDLLVSTLYYPRIPYLASATFPRTYSRSHKMENNSRYELLDPSLDKSWSQSVRTQPKKTLWGSTRLWKDHNKEIVIACSLVLLPMVGFSVLILGLVFDNRFSLNECPSPELCHNVNSPDLLRGFNYYVDLPVGRLAFISSLSATISFSCVAALMTLYAFSTARHLTTTHELSGEFEKNPSPHDITLIIRLLDADTSLLWELATRFFKRSTVHPHDGSSKKQARKPRVFYACISVFSLCLLGGYVRLTLYFDMN
jgi:hypothetical protein